MVRPPIKAAMYNIDNRFVFKYLMDNNIINSSKHIIGMSIYAKCECAENAIETVRKNDAIIPVLKLTTVRPIRYVKNTDIVPINAVVILEIKKTCVVKLPIPIFKTGLNNL
jgi:hypothetical protein